MTGKKNKGIKLKMLKKLNRQELTAENSGKEKKQNEVNGLESESRRTRNWQCSKTPVEDG